MRKTAIFLIALLLLAVGAYAQTHRDGIGSSDSFDLTSAAVGAVAGGVAGYLIGVRRNKA